MKRTRIICLLIFLSYIFILSACQSSNETENAIKIYQKFLEGNIKSEEGYGINEMTIPTGEPGRRYSTRYAFFDSTGDGIPDLHVNATRYYYIFTYKNNELVLWNDLSPSPYSHALSNGAFMEWKPGAAPYHDYFCYYIYNYSGDTILTISFSRYDKNANSIYDNKDEYTFNGVKVTKEIWEGLVDDYIGIDETVNSDILNQIEWNVLYEAVTASDLMMR